MLARPERRWSATAALAGSFLPDAPMFVMFAYAKLAGLGHADLWPEPYGLYWNPVWQAWINAAHSLPVYLALLGLALAVRLDWLKVFALAGLLHIAFDFPFHREDGHAHLWPFSNWKFVSPVSYWDPAHYGTIMLPIEAAIVAVSIAVLWRRYESLWSRLALGGAAAAFVAVPAYFILVHHH